VLVAATPADHLAALGFAGLGRSSGGFWCDVIA
jgi:hypothetical protein